MVLKRILFSLLIVGKKHAIVDSAGIGLRAVDCLVGTAEIQLLRVFVHL
jgi:hypothetical protein